MSATQPLSQTANEYADQAAMKADGVIRSTQRVANDTLDQLSQSVHAARDAAAPVIGRVADRAETLARRSVDTVRNGTEQLRLGAQRAADQTAGYVQAQPLKSMLMAVAAGAALAVLMGFFGRSPRA